MASSFFEVADELSPGSGSDDDAPVDLLGLDGPPSSANGEMFGRPNWSVVGVLVAVVAGLLISPQSRSTSGFLSA